MRNFLIVNAKFPRYISIVFFFHAQKGLCCMLSSILVFSKLKLIQQFNFHLHLPTTCLMSPYGRNRAVPCVPIPHSKDGAFAPCDAIKKGQSLMTSQCSSSDGHQPSSISILIGWAQEVYPGYQFDFLLSQNNTVMQSHLCFSEFS